MDDKRKQDWRTDIIHFAALWCLGVAQPIFDLLGENPAFFVAHDARRAELIAFVLLLWGVGPLGAVLLSGMASRIGPRVRTVTTWVIVTALLVVIALPVAKRTWQWDAVTTLAASGAASAIVAFAYLRLYVLRLFVTFLAPAIIVVPVLFALQPGVTRLLRTSEVGSIPGVEFGTTPPIVMVVFDQLPLVSLLDRHGQIDAELYPHFSLLADESTWFSNASGVSDLTELAMPALLTGVMPEAGKLPVVDEHPHNLFTLFGSRYRVEAEEPITRLCPDSVCQGGRLSILDWFRSALPDVAIVYLHITLPDELADRLPSVTQNWTNFAANDNPGGRWSRLRGTDRQLGVAEFIKNIMASGEDDHPSLYFLHVLIPHEPWVHLPSGQRYSNGWMPGLNRDGRWSDNEMAVLRSYQRHLLQVRFADTLLGQILERLRGVRLYDDALIVVTADHGAAFQPGGLFRRPQESAFVEMAAVPLLIKTPGERVGRVVRTNIEAIDIVPTMARVLGVDVPWVPDGTDLLAAGAEGRSEKVVVLAGGGGTVAGPPDLWPAISAAVAQKHERFDIPDGFDQPNLGLYDELVGKSLQDLALGPPSKINVIVDAPELFRDVDRTGPFVPAHLTGAVTGLDEDTAWTTVLAVSLNGVVAGVTRPYDFPVRGRRGAWELIVDPQRVVAGSNKVGVYVIRSDQNRSVVLEEAFSSTAIAPSPNLMLDQAALVRGVVLEGFYDLEWSSGRPFRWTSEAANLRVPIDPEVPPRTLVIDVLMTGPVPKVLAVTINDDCTVFDAEISGAWSASLPLAGCRIDEGMVDVQFRSQVNLPIRSDVPRQLGVALASVELR